MWADTYCVGNSGRQAKPASYIAVDRGALSSKERLQGALVPEGGGWKGPGGLSLRQWKTLRRCFRHLEGKFHSGSLRENIRPEKPEGRNTYLGGGSGGGRAEA